MKKLQKGAFTTKINQQADKYKCIKLPLTLCDKLVAAGKQITSFFIHNTKRLAFVLAIFVFYFTSSSFSFLSQKEGALFPKENEWAEIQENYDYVPITFQIPPDTEVIDDNDVLEGYDNEELIVTSDELDQYSLDDILEANEMGVDAEGIEQTPKHIHGSVQSAGAGLSKVSKDDWQLVLVNKQHPVPDDYTFTLGKIKGTMKCDVRIIDDLMDMMQAAKEDGIKLVVCSPYRDYNRQTVLFNRKIDHYMEKGYSYLEAYRISSMTVTVPGASEHQIGLALDIVSTTYSELEIDFGKTEAGIWLKEHCAEYGFILRYPLGKEYITGIQYEPWHFRYVGKEAAANIMERGITLEEFLDELE